VATIDKDFKVKNGLVVALGGSFGGAVEVGTPTLAAHAATKDYVDGKFGTFLVPTESQAPSSPQDGQLYFDTITRHLSIYSTDSGSWIMIASFDDTATLQQHIHDTAIDGTGLIVTMFQDAGFYDSIFSSQIDAGSYDTNVFTATLDGGNPTDNFN
jgi:hypothetical protein